MAEPTPGELHFPSPERTFVALALVFGIGFSVVSPPLDPADERRHLHRAFAMSEGHFAPIGAAPGYVHQIPESFNALHPPYRFATPDGRVYDRKVPRSEIICLHDPGEIASTLSIALEPDIRVDGRTPLPYGPISYVPQAVALFAGRHLGVSAGGLLYLGRLATLASWVMMGWLAIRHAPVRKWSLLPVLLGPMSLHQASVLSADAVTNGLALLLLIGVVRLAVKPERLDALRMATALLLCVGLSASKQGYWVLGLLLLIPPSECFSSRSIRFAFIGAAALAMIGAAFGWIGALDAADPSRDSMRELGDVGTVLSTFPEALARVRLHWQPLVTQYVGVLGHLDVVMPRWVYTALPLGMVVIAAFDSADAPRLAWQLRLGLLGVFAAALLGLFGVLYIASPQQNEFAIAGMLQGRHLLPLAPVLLLALPAPLSLPSFWGPVAITSFCAASLTLAVGSVAHHYFVRMLAGLG